MTFRRLRPVGIWEARSVSLQNSLFDDLYCSNLARDGFEYGAAGQISVGLPEGDSVTGAGWAGSTIKLSGGTRFLSKAERIASINSDDGVQI